MRFACILLLLAGLSHELSAQEVAPLQPSRFSFELSIGAAHTRGSGTYIEANESALWGDLLAAARVRPVAGGFLLAAANAATRITPRVTTSICLLDPQGACTPHFPSFRMVAAGIGWENALATRRLLLGPALVDSDVARSSLGWQVRFDLAGIVTRRIAFVAGARATLVPNHSDDTFGIFGATLGVRIR